MIEWTQVLVALAVGLPATIAAVGAILQGLRTANKVDENTQLTKAGSMAAATHAAVAASAASEAKEATQSLAKKLNGDLDNRITQAVEQGVNTVLKSLQEHTEQDEQNMLEIRNLLASLTTQKGKK